MKKLIFLIISLNIFLIEGVRVCKNFDDYYNPFSKNCYNNPDDDSNVTNIVGRWGYKAEEYPVTTNDGYQLTIFRIKPKTRSSSPVLLAHGIFLNCLCFINRGNKSLAYTYLKNGFDVWLMNFRGTRFSRGHVKLTTNDLEYWNFTFQELATKDLSSTLQLITNETQQKAVYVGFSLGTTVGYVYTSTYSNEARSYLNGVISLAPIVYFNNIKSLLKTFDPDRFLLRNFVNTVWGGEALPRSLPTQICVLTPVMMRFCSSVMAVSLGEDFDQMDPTTFPVSVTQDADATSFKLVDHFSQIMTTSIFQQYNYSGAVGNRIRYGQNDPPIYDLGKVSVPMLMFIGPNDWLATPQNAQKIYTQFPPQVQCGFHLVKYKKFSHTDFLFAKDIVKIFYEDLLKVTIDFKNGICENIYRI